MNKQYFGSKTLKGKDAILFEKRRKKMKYGEDEKQRILNAFKSLSNQPND